MLVEVFKALLLTSVIGTVLVAVLMLLRPVTKKFFSAGWHYYMWLAVLLVMVLPVKFDLPEEIQFFKEHEAVAEDWSNAYANEHVYTIIWQYIEDEVPVNEESVGYSVSGIIAFAEWVKSKADMISFTWLIVAVVLFAVKVAGYILFKYKLIRNSDEFLCPEINAFTKRNIIVKKSPLINSPIMIGVLRPMLVLPCMELTKDQLRNILSHEMTHFKRHDIAVKWFITLAKCVHWFNPMVYIIVKQISLWCEISCDIAAVERMDNEGKRSYIDTILAFISTGRSKNIPLTTGMLSSKEMLKRRFLMIKNKSIISKKAKIVSGILATALLVGTLGVSGVLANDVLDGETTEVAEYSYTEAEIIKESIAATTDADVVYEAGNAEEVQVGSVMNNEAGEYSGEFSYTYTNGTMTVDTAADDKVETKETEIIWPCASSGNITATFATRVNPVTGEIFTHNGIDVAVKTGTEIVAAIGGKVTLAGWDGSYGYNVVISDGDTEIRYAHLSEILVEKGDNVAAGQLVAKSGNTGNSTGPHLHFELKIDGQNVDPSLYVK
ncbi:MAG: peptidoglycan DD-metalloendopeptidase family protein [Lachnospiraceae bacterium]|nr:peptidoglycan DD-metalloendopeptidase family protein [Lachnospiraceae bacterium]